HSISSPCGSADPPDLHSFPTRRSSDLVRAGQVRTGFNEHAEALFLTSSFVFDNAEQAAARFTGTEGGFVYSRFTNPTVAMKRARSEEHTSELQSRGQLVCRLLLEKKKG